MRIAPLAEVTTEDMEELLAEEICEWKSQLNWDFRPTADLIKRYVRTRSLSGSVLREKGGRICGYEYHVSDPPIGFVGDVFLRRDSATEEAYSRLLGEAVDSLTQNRRLMRIECQLFPFNFELKPLFLKRGFRAFTRYFLSRRVDPAPVVPDFCSGLDIQPWDGNRVRNVAGVIFDSYEGSADRELCHDYQSLSGCTRFLHNIMDSPGCGVFSKVTSLVATDRTGEIIGVLVTSNINAETGMIPQLSVRRECQGRGIGTALLNRYFELALKSGLKRVSLSVSAINDSAYGLYRRFGFKNKKTFYAYIKNDLQAGLDFHSER